MNFEIKAIDDSVNCKRYIENVVSGRILKLIPNKIKTEIDEKREPIYKRTCFIISLPNVESTKTVLLNSTSNILSLVPHVMSDEMVFNNDNHMSVPINIKFSSNGVHLRFESEFKDHSSVIHSVDVIGVNSDELTSKLDAIGDESKYFESVELFGFFNGDMKLDAIKKLEGYIKEKFSNVNTCFTSTYASFNEKELV